MVFGLGPVWAPAETMRSWKTGSVLEKYRICGGRSAEEEEEGTHRPVEARQEGKCNQEQMANVT